MGIVRSAYITSLFVVAVGCGDNHGSGPDAGSPDASPGEKRLVIFHTNDEHSHLFGFAPEIDDFPAPTTAGTGAIIGSAARRAAILDDQRAAAAAAGMDTLTVSAGDQSQGALPQIAYTTTAPDFTVLQTMGYDVICPGNHEFDRGPAAYAAAITAAEANGGIPQIVSTNIRFDATDPGDDALAALFGEGTAQAPIKRYHVITTPSGIKVGFFGVMGVDASYYAPFKGPVLFSAEPSEEGDRDTVLPKLYDDIRPTIAALRDTEHVDVVIMVSHGGVNLDFPDAGDDYKIAQNVTGIDLIVSGHSHTALPAPIVVAAPDGYMVPIVQAGSYGEWLGRVELVTQRGARPHIDLDSAKTKLIKVDDTTVPTNTAILDKLDDLITTLEANDLEAVLGRVLGVSVTDDPGTLGDLYYRSLGTTAFPVIGKRSYQETEILDLSTDSMLATAEAEAGPTMLAVQAAGSVRDDILPGETGAMSFADLYRIFPLGLNPVNGSIGYPLCRFYLWTVEIKAAFEVAASQGLINDSFFLSASGVRVEFDTSRPAFDVTNPFDPTNGRVTKISVDVDHSDGVDNPTVDLFDINRAMPWVSSLGDSVTLQPVVTSLYVASFADAAGVTLKTAAGTPTTPVGTIMTRGDGSDIKDYESFIGYVHAISAANGGMLPSSYDEATGGPVPRRMICSGPLCP